jgi:hypothetical protein
MASFALFNRSSAGRFSAVTVDDITHVIKLSTLGMTAQHIKTHLSDVAAGKSNVLTLEPPGRKPLVIQAYSFLRDSNQFEVLYGMSAEVASGLIKKLETDPEFVRQEIQKVVYARLALTKSPRPVSVIFDGAPSGKVPGGPTGTHDGGAAELGRLISQNSVVYGLFQPEVEDSNVLGESRFRVRLGGGLVVVGQSKLLAVRAAKVVNVNGRDHSAVARLVRGVDKNGRLLDSTQIPADWWSGKAVDEQSKPRDDVMTPSSKDDESDDEDEPVAKAAAPAVQPAVAAPTKSPAGSAASSPKR